MLESTRNTGELENTDDDNRLLIETRKNQLWNSIVEKEIEERIAGRLLIHDNQDETAKEVVDIIINKPKILFQLVNGLTQSGKTGCMIAVIKSCLTMGGCNLIINPNNIFIVTGLSSNDWCNQTKGRFPRYLVNNIFHRGDLKRLGEKLNEKVGERKENLRDILIIMDEIHIASKETMSLDKMLIQDTGFKDMKILHERNINFVEFSATPNKVLDDITSWEDYAKHHVMQAGPGYKGVKEQIDNNKAFQAEDLYIDTDPNDKMTTEERKLRRKTITPAIKAIEQIKLKVFEYDSPKYHIIRLPSGDKFDVVLGRFKKVFGIIAVDHKPCHVTSENKVVQSLIKEVPSQHTLIYIKEHLRCAVTLEPKTNIGILYERIGSSVNDDVITQGLAGRATGYDVPDDILIYTNLESLKRYITVWESGFKDTGDFNYRGRSKSTVMNPKGYDNTGLVDKEEQKPEWDLDMKEFDNLEEANVFLHENKCRRKNKLKKNDHGFILSTTTKKLCVLEYKNVKVEIANFKNTTLMDLTKKDKTVHSRMIIAYKNPIDKGSAVYIVRIISKIT